MAHEYVKISELEPTSSFGTTDQFVIVQDNETVKIVGADLVQSLATLTNLATRSYVDAVVDSAPGTLDTLRELAAALNDDANFGAKITALINEKLPASNFGLEFWKQIATVNTYHIQEGSNLYWTQDRFDSALAAKNTYHVTEGSNLYFTVQRVLDVVTPLLEEFSPVIGNDPTFNSVTATQLNVQNVAFTGTGAVTIASGNDLNFTAAGDITFNGQNLFSGSYDDLTNRPVNPTYNTVTISGSVTNPKHAATKAYVDSKVSSIPSPSWNSLVNISNNLGPTRIALGRNAGGSSDADGYGGYGGYGAYGGSSFAIAIGNSSGKTNQGGAAIGIGVASGYNNQGEGAIAIGLTAGNDYQGGSAIAIGASAGNISQGTNAIAIGSLAGKTNQPAGSIVINASGNELNGSSAGLFVDPIRNADATSYVAYYNPTTKEVTYGPAPSGDGGAMSPDPVFNSVSTTDLNVQNVTFSGTGPVTINSNNDLNFTAIGEIRFNGVKPVTSYNDLLDKPTLLKGDTGPQGLTGATGPQGIPGPNVTPLTLIKTLTNSYTVTTADHGYYIRMNSTLQTTITLPSDSGENIPVGTTIVVGNVNTGTVTFLAGAGAQVYSSSTLTISNRWAKVTVMKTDANVWELEGNLAS